MTALTRGVTLNYAQLVDLALAVEPLTLAEVAGE